MHTVEKPEWIDTSGSNKILDLFFAPEKTKKNKKECYICDALETKGQYSYANRYTTIAIQKGDNGKYRCFAWGENEASVSCNYCPNCGRQLEKEIKGE